MLNDMCTVLDISFPELDDHLKRRHWYLQSLKENQQVWIVVYACTVKILNLFCKIPELALRTCTTGC